MAKSCIKPQLTAAPSDDCRESPFPTHRPPKAWACYDGWSKFVSKRRSIADRPDSTPEANVARHSQTNYPVYGGFQLPPSALPRLSHVGCLTGADLGLLAPLSSASPFPRRTRTESRGLRNRGLRRRREEYHRPRGGVPVLRPWPRPPARRWVAGSRAIRDWAAFGLLRAGLGRPAARRRQHHCDSTPKRHIPRHTSSRRSRHRASGNRLRNWGAVGAGSPHATPRE